MLRWELVLYCAKTQTEAFCLLFSLYWTFARPGTGLKKAFGKLMTLSSTWRDRHVIWIGTVQREDASLIRDTHKDSRRAFLQKTNILPMAREGIGFQAEGGTCQRPNIVWAEGQEFWMGKGYTFYPQHAPDFPTVGKKSQEDGQVVYPERLVKNCQAQWHL